MCQELVFITGATGFIGSQVLQNVLRAGHRARISVRKAAQIGELGEIFTSHTDQLDFVTIPDFTASNAFDEVLDDVTYLIHVASPMPSVDGDVKEAFVDPAVRATESILEAASATKSVKRVVIMASAVALMPMGTVARKVVVIKGE
jgi:nucleoside-diphosphate-sugar epimerase